MQHPFTRAFPETHILARYSLPLCCSGQPLGARLVALCLVQLTRVAVFQPVVLLSVLVTQGNFAKVAGEHFFLQH